MSSEKVLKRPVFRWTIGKGFTATLLFFALAIITEYFLVWFFVSSRLIDRTAFVTTLQVPLTGRFFALTISPLFHLIPFGVVVVLFSAWTYFTKSIETVSQRGEPVKKTLTPRKRKISRGKTHFKQFGRFSRKVDRRFRSLRIRLEASFHRVSSAALRMRGVSYVFQRLGLAKAAIKSAVITIVVFLVFFFLFYLLGYPSSIYNAVTGLYRADPTFLNFVIQTTSIGRGLAQVLAPIRALTSATLNAAPGFRSTLENLGTPLVSPVATLDSIAKYAFFQYFAAIISALILVIYGESSPYPRHKS